MTLTLGWQNHMLATHEAVEETIDRIKRIAVDGRSPANHLLTPLATNDWAAIEAGLARIGEQFTDMLERVAPEQLRSAKETQPFSATRYHLSLALMSLEQEILAGIDPDQRPRRGMLVSADKDAIRSSLTEMRAEVANLRSFVDQLSESKPQPNSGEIQ